MTDKISRKKQHKKILSEMEDLLNIPLMERLLVHKIEEIKATLGEEINTYRKISEKLQYSDTKLKGREFRLTRQGKSLWVPSLLTPLLPGEELPKIMPRQLVTFMVEYPAEPGLIISKTEFTLPELEGRVFDVYFEKLQEDLIAGIISEKSPKTLEKALFETLHEDWVNVAELQELFDCLLSDKTYYHFALRQFKLVWRPLLVQQRRKLP